ncbi:hypothetical protein RvY_06554 [Ramazzottius varieornatus]|uniref:Complex 1 LYR protein domain-containing protein n=1 Tax=Ramazzottius varieornatus TaxID=947166 RepID=A0A1D1UZ01_RAMVA|nr:hypothetical protein RvY_06554 [Ramazzottius varieornatus]
MSHVATSRVQALKLYKNLLRYSQRLQYTDKDYFVERIRTEFEQNRDVQDQAELDRCLKVKQTNPLPF